MTTEHGAAYDYTMKLRGQVPGPHKIWVSNPGLNEAIVPVGVHHQGHSSPSKAGIEIATNLINARWLAAYSTMNMRCSPRSSSIFRRLRLKAW